MSERQPLENTPLEDFLAIGVKLGTIPLLDESSGYGLGSVFEYQLTEHQPPAILSVFFERGTVRYISPELTVELKDASRPRIEIGGSSLAILFEGKNSVLSVSRKAIALLAENDFVEGAGLSVPSAPQGPFSVNMILP